MSRYPIPPPRLWAYRPQVGLGWRNLRPMWLGNDQYHRRTLVLGFPWTGELVVALREFDRDGCADGECGPQCQVCGTMIDHWGRCPDPRTRRAEARDLGTARSARRMRRSIREHKGHGQPFEPWEDDEED